ncbi:SurA N-terminal domain-containing protein [Diaphorobacter caeni]|uniref:SurA N-terminal domain-containing protein n=1 Tax=Diaphorobacter caeni TaxID=2784387 RepID=UPI0018905B40|nr:SurA N-terminal domain-containing protein [Diaphorobacter caeni]MBF5005628.1 SurA N-terminal domain-containing protein [Diaphorobacter caeni]
MFEAIRKHSKIVMFLLVLLIVPSFILVGVNQNYFTEKSPVVARVNGKDITQADWDAAHRQASDRLRAQNPTMDSKLLDSPQAKYETLERIVRDKVYETAARDMHFATTDVRLARELQKIPQIAALRKPDGTLDGEAYKALVGAQGLTPEGFENQVRYDLSVNQVMGGVLTSSFSTVPEVKLAMDAVWQGREIQVARFDANNYTAKVTASDADVEAFYKANAPRFQQNEQASVEYLVLDLDSVKATIVPNEEDLRTYYKENLERLSGKEERRASHILISASKDASSADREKAKAKAEAILAEVRKNPGSFADVAKKESEDPGSAKSGGDLGFFSRGSMVKPFEEAAYALKKGDISDVVASDFGFHIIMLTDVKTPPRPSFEELRPKLEADLKDQQAQRKFAEMADTFSNTVYEQGDNLKAVADKFKLKLQTVANVARVPGPETQGPLANARFLEALFAQDSLQNKRSTEAVEVGPSMLAAGRVTQYSPAMTIPWEQAKVQAKAFYTADKAAEMARQDGDAKLAAWKAAPASATGLSAPVTVSREQAHDQPRAVLDAVLQAPIDNLPTWVGVNLGAAGYAVAKIDKIVPRAAQDAATYQKEQQQYTQVWSGVEAMAYYELLKQHFKAEIKVPRPSAE